MSTTSRRLASLSFFLAGALALVSAEDNAIPFSPGFDIAQVAALAQSLPSESWEFGTAAEALLELHNPELSVFGDSPFPVASGSKSSIQALVYAADKIVIGSTGLSNGNGATGDPASLGVSAVMLGKTNKTFADAAAVQLAYLLDTAPRYSNGAISQRADKPVLWADFMYMAPPFMAFYAADSGNATLLRDTYKQCGLYRDVLQSNGKGLWKHIVGPEAADPGHWSTGNAWAAAGMARVLATIMRAPVAQDVSWCTGAISDLSGWIKEILDAAMGAPLDGGLLRNYIDSSAEPVFGEISGSSLLASVAYRMAVLRPDAFDASYVAWADGIRKEFGTGGHVKSGVVSPAVNPHNWHDPDPDTSGSPEGQAMVVLMYAAWRDCVVAGTCQQAQAKTQTQATKTTEVLTQAVQTSQVPRRKCSANHAARRALQLEQSRRMQYVRRIQH
ncbi:Unsaturated rhamnogalacturonyl hydrolase YesR [Mycena venus]|uniref:Unsaturated rhamnogalacturonyl hydrolase YesR n=1 Tax=Mycena venus TaxID=2733690 RepID=A0A8H6XPA7_9AGAR|nr:Unsaturated rhamnogalacturonyl hydrolase YesR [Mycena venus]